MTVSTTTVKTVYEGNGSTKIFSIVFKYLQATEVKVYLRDNSVDPFTETLLTSGVEYSLTDVVGGLATNVTMVTAPADNSADVGEQLVVKRVTPLTQSTTPSESATVEAVDRGVMISQELDEVLDRTMKLPLSSTLTDIEVPEGAGEYLKWNAGGTALETASVSTTTIEADIATNTANIAINAAAVAANVALIATNAANISTNASNIATNASNISSHGTRITATENDIITNAAAISANGVNIAELIAFMGQVGTFTLANNQAVATAITPFIFDGDDYTSVEIEIEIRRTTDTASQHSTAIIYCLFNHDSVWEFERGLTSFDLDGITFSIATTAGNIGTVKYTSDNLLGTSYAGTIKYRIKKFEV